MIFNFLFFFVFGTSTTLVFSFSNNVTDQQALLSFKSSITDDPSGVLDSWNNSISFCYWTGITCSRRRERVTVLNLPSLHLEGTLSPHIGNLSFLRTIYLYENRFHGLIPNEIGRLFRLQRLSLGSNSFQGAFPAALHDCTDIRFINFDTNHLEGELAIDFASWSKLDMFCLSNNHFNGSIPSSIGNISSLRSLYLDGNNFEGKLPIEFASWSKLDMFSLSNNHFSGSIPPSIGNISSLRSLYLDGNNFEGKLPTEFASWSKLEMFSLSNNHFSGSIPPSIGNISSLRLLSLSNNNFEGGIPLEVAHLAKLEFLDLSSNILSGMVPLPLYNFSYLNVFGLTNNVLEGMLPSDLGFTLPKLQEFDIGINRFSGPLPPSIVNASNLIIFSVLRNNITGPIPNNLGSLPHIQFLDLGDNPLGEKMRPNEWSFFISLVNCTQLKSLGLGNIGLRGELPGSVANLSTTMEEVFMTENYIYGRIPHGIGKLVNMINLQFGDNLLTGSIPESIGRLSKLGFLDFSINNISGVLPTSITNITQLVKLYLGFNMLQGSIPTGLFDIPNIQTVFLSYNRLNGVISEQIVGLSSQCIFLYLETNLFTGPLTSNIGSLKHLVHLSISNNKLTGQIPATLGGCVMLEELSMDGNLFQGKIPPSLKALKSLMFLDLSNNNICGDIPSFFVGFHLINFLNLSHNKLGGEVPREGLFSNVSAFSVIGNLELCGGIQALHFPACHKKVSRNKEKAFVMGIILIVVLVPLCMLLACLAFISYRRRNSKKLNDPVLGLKDDKYPKLSYQDLLLATDEFSLDNLIGEGRYGLVYKGNLESVEHIFAVKVLNVAMRGANKTFLAECETLRNIRHRNLMKIITACSSIDFKGNDFKALIFEFMTNGSLDSWLHPSPSYQGYERNLSLLQRLNISIDVALGVDYLHHHSHASIIHCDLKPSNILLDKDFVARIGDFGLAKLCYSAATSDINMSSTGVRGTVGYVPPEYGMFGDMSIEGDVYSYGILLLEIFSGKRPTESSILIDGSSNLHDYVRKALPQRVMDIADPRILLHQEEHGSAVKQSYGRAIMEVCLESIFEVGILCSEEMPQKRIDISVAIKKLHVARDKLLHCRN